MVRSKIVLRARERSHQRFPRQTQSCSVGSELSLSDVHPEERLTRRAVIVCSDSRRFGRNSLRQKSLDVAYNCKLAQMHGLEFGWRCNGKLFDK